MLLFVNGVGRRRGNMGAALGFGVPRFIATKSNESGKPARLFRHELNRNRLSGLNVKSVSGRLRFVSQCGSQARQGARHGLRRGCGNRRHARATPQLHATRWPWIPCQRVDHRSNPALQFRVPATFQPLRGFGRQVDSVAGHARLRRALTSFHGTEGRGSARTSAMALRSATASRCSISLST